MNSAVEISSTSRPGGVSACTPAAAGTLARLPAADQQHLIDPFGRDHAGSESQRLLEVQTEWHEGMVIPPHGTLTVMPQPPHAEIEQPRGARRHSEPRTFFELQMMLRQLRLQPLRLVAALMTDEVIERRPHRWVQGR